MPERVARKRYDKRFKMPAKPKKRRVVSKTYKRPTGRKQNSAHKAVKGAERVARRLFSGR